MIDIVNATGLDKSTVHRVLKSMTKARLLVTGNDPRRYHLGPFLYELVGVASAGFDFHTLAEPVLQSLTQQTGNTILFTLREGLDGLCVRRMSGAYPIQVLTVEEGARRPLGVGAGTQALLAALPEAECSAILSANRARYVSLGLDAAVVAQQVQRIKEMGYASQRTVSTEAAWSLAIAILSSSGRPLASISVVGITERMIGNNQEAILEALRSAKSHIEAEMACA